jgi:hypothetical protein
LTKRSKSCLSLTERLRMQMTRYPLLLSIDGVRMGMDARGGGMCRAFSPWDFRLAGHLGLLTPAGKGARRGPRFGPGWYVAGLRPLTAASFLRPLSAVSGRWRRDSHVSEARHGAPGGVRRWGGCVGVLARAYSPPVRARAVTWGCAPG